MYPYAILFYRRASGTLFFVCIRIELLWEGRVASGRPSAGPCRRKLVGAL